MRLVIDLQTSQGASAERGIGRYALELAKALARSPRGHEVLVTINEQLPRSPEDMIQALAGCVPADRVRVWRSLPNTRTILPGADWRRTASQRIRWDFFERLQPDMVLTGSVIEGYLDDVISLPPQITSAFATAAVFFDAIPLIYPERYLPDPITENAIRSRYSTFAVSDAVLAISASSAREAVEYCGVTPERVTNIMAGVSEGFRPIPLDPTQREQLQQAYGLRDGFVLFVGGGDSRKNAVNLLHAYVALPPILRRRHPLAIGSRLLPNEVATLKHIAAAGGVDPEDLIFTDFIAEIDLPALYSACSLFVYPSLHEGFGLPVLEAMACGAPAIGSNTTSIPEVIDHESAMFDPADSGSIAERMRAVLTDPTLQTALREHGLRRAAALTWAACAERAWDALEIAIARPRTTPTVVAAHKPRLLVSAPLALAGTEAEDAALLHALSAYYDVTLSGPVPTTSWWRERYGWVDPSMLHNDPRQYDRVLHLLSNSVVHGFQLDKVLYDAPGIVALRDIHLGSTLLALDAAIQERSRFVQSLYDSHGASAMKDLVEVGDTKTAERWPCSLPVLQEAIGVIVHSRCDLDTITSAYGSRIAESCTVVPQLHVASPPHERTASRKRVAIGATDLLICSFGPFTLPEEYERLMTAFAMSRVGQRGGHRLVFVGGSNAEVDPIPIRAPSGRRGVENSIMFTGTIDDKASGDWLAAADIVVQLRAMTGGKLARAVLASLAAGCATIVNDVHSMGELPVEAAFHLPAAFTDADLAAALDELSDDAALRADLALRGRAYIHENRSPDAVAAAYRTAIERHYSASPRASGLRLMQSIAIDTAGMTAQPGDIDTAAAAAVASIEWQRGPELIVEVTHTDRASGLVGGIPRVVREVTRALILARIPGIRVEPVKAAGASYRYASHFAAALVGAPQAGLVERDVEVAHASCLLLLDLDLDPMQADRIRLVRRRGGTVYAVLYDLQPIDYPDSYSPETVKAFQRWVELICTECDGVACISRASADRLQKWLEEGYCARARDLPIGVFHLGSASVLPDLEVAQDEANVVAEALSGGPTVLMVGQTHRHKGYVQALAAFEHLWAQGQRIKLIVAGPDDGNDMELRARIDQHPELGKRLVRLIGLSDVALSRLYRGASLFLGASFTEGFGLPVVEAARHGQPLLLRDIPIYREIAGESALYFRGDDPKDLAAALHDWHKRDLRNEVPKPTTAVQISWAESARQLLDIIVNGNWDRIYKIRSPTRGNHDPSGVAADY